RRSRGGPGRRRPVAPVRGWRRGPRVRARTSKPRRGVPRAHGAGPSRRRPRRPRHVPRRRRAGGGRMSPPTTAPTHRDEAGIDPAVLVRTDERPAPPSPTQASLTFAWRAVLRIRHVPEQLLDVTL